MVRKRSWPAVSQIWSLMFLLLLDTVLKRKSTPMVVMQFSLNWSSAKRSSRQLLPTEESPTITNFSRWSYSRLRWLITLKYYNIGIRSRSYHHTHTFSAFKRQDECRPMPNRKSPCPPPNLLITEYLDQNQLTFPLTNFSLLQPLPSKLFPISVGVQWRIACRNSNINNFKCMNQNDFTVIARLGTGSYGEVHRVRRISDNTEYAMKKVKIMDLKEKDKKNALNEIRILASIEHPNIVQYREAFFDNHTNHLCIVMELAPRGDLAKLIQQKFKNAEGFFEYEVWKYGAQILAGLKHLHSMNIIHRDLKPANIFFGGRDEVKIGDLNVSRKLQGGLAHTQTGTPNYASPEIWNNEPYGFDCDVWSFGCIIYELCTFKPPFRSKDMDELFRRVQNGAYDRIPKRYSFMLEDTIALCLQKRSKRATVDQLIEIFEKYSSNAPQVLKRVVSSSTLLGTIEFPKDKNDFSHVLPSPKYDAPKESLSEVFSKRPASGIKENVLNRYLKPETPLKRKRLTNEVYYAERPEEIKEIRSEKLLPEASIEKRVERGELQAEKNRSFKEILRSLEDARMVQRRVERNNLHRRNLNLRLAVKF